MIGWILYGLGVLLLALAAFVNNDGDIIGSLVIAGLGLLVAAFIYGLNKL
jgi:hypothetical protein